jgi:CRP/FNR family transcriptional regulator
MRSTYHAETIDNFFDSKLCARQLLADLRPEAQEQFEALKRAKDFPAGSNIFAEGEPPEGVFVLNRGQAKLILNSNGQREQIVRVAGPGELLGLSATIADEPYEVTARALSPCRMDFISRAKFLNFLHEHGEACFRIVQLLGQTLHESYEQFRLFERTPSAAVKLAYVLLNWSEEGEKTSEGIRLNIPLTHEGIARMIGTSRETVTRAFGDFKSRQIISVEGSTLLIRDQPALRAIRALARTKL